MNQGSGLYPKLATVNPYLDALNTHINDLYTHHVGVTGHACSRV